MTARRKDTTYQGYRALVEDPEAGAINVRVELPGIGECAGYFHRYLCAFGIRAGTSRCMAGNLTARLPEPGSLPLMRLARRS